MSLYISDSRGTISRSLAQARTWSIAGAVLLVSMGGCAVNPRAGTPKEVKDLAARQQGTLVVVSWVNPQDFDRVEVSVPGLGWSRPGPSSTGQAEKVLYDVPAGEYELSLSCWAKIGRASCR